MLHYGQNMQIFNTIVFACVIVISLLIKIFFKNKSEKVRSLPLYIIGGIIILLEFFKQLKNFLGYDYAYFFSLFTGEKDEFSEYAFPFHFCSFFIFWILFQFIFIKSKRLSKFFKNMTFLWSTFIFVFVFFYPDMIYESAVNSFMEGGRFEHTLLFHVLSVLYFGVALGLRDYKFEMKKFYQAPACMLIYGAFAIPAAHIFKENYCSIYSYEGWDFLKPVFEKGYVLYNGVLIIIAIILSSLFFLGLCGIEKLRDKVKDNKWYLIGYAAMIVGMVVLHLISKATGYDTLASMYSIYLTLVALICELPATIKGHFFRKNLIEK